MGFKVVVYSLNSPVLLHGTSEFVTLILGMATNSKIGIRIFCCASIRIFEYSIVIMCICDLFAQSLLYESVNRHFRLNNDIPIINNAQRCHQVRLKNKENKSQFTHLMFM
jgi:hypothetical protein